MADLEFEQLSKPADLSSWPCIRLPTDPYTLVHDVSINDDSPSDPYDADEDDHPQGLENCFDNGPGPPDATSESPQKVSKKRRILPEIPQNKVKSLADELRDAVDSDETETGLNFAIGGPIRRPNILLQTGRSSPQEFDFDSGNSTAHSPDLVRPSLILQCQDSPGSWSEDQVELLEPTHRGLHRFVPRHHDEILIDIGDPIYVDKEDEDLWCEGTNLRTGHHGVFPAAHVVDVDYTEFGWPSGRSAVRRERFLLGYLGSVEVRALRGDHVIMHAVSRCKAGNSQPRPTILEVTDSGIRMQDRGRQQQEEAAAHDYWYALKNVSWCSHHPRDPRFLGFITRHPRHPLCEKFACHVFQGNHSTRPVAEAIGMAFQRFYQSFMDEAFPVEDIYLE